MKFRLRLDNEIDLLTKGELDQSLEHHGRWEREAAFGRRHQLLPRMVGTPAAGALALGADQPDQPMVGPGSGWVWAVHRVSVGGLLAATSTVNQASAQTYNTATTPAAGQTVVATNALPAGTYQVTVTPSITGTTSAGDQNNMSLYAGGVFQTQLITNPGLVSPTAGPFTIKLAAAGTFVVKAQALATTGAIYAAQITAQPVNTATGQDSVQLYKLNNFVGQIDADPGYLKFGRAELLLKAGEYLRVVGTGLNTTAQVEVTGEGESAPQVLAWTLL